MPRRVFEKELLKLQTELVRLQEWVKHKGLRVIVVFEGRDAAGKGGVIKRITERVSARVFDVVALPAPSDRQKTQMYIQRYMEHFPAAGEVKLFDRSWYNRAGVEHVMGFCTDDEYQRFLQLVPNFEREMVRDGIILIKYFFDVSEAEQERRFIRRYEDPMRQWKLSPMDVESWARWWDYTAAYEHMIAATDTPVAPWYKVQADDKRRARLNCISHLLSMIPYEPLPFDAPEVPKKKKRQPGTPDSPMFLHVVPERY
ncbi:MAG: polyphosphate kinase 2 [Alphaproteobacteria bacterium]|nr:polyphosphate kinase 2 [Alphaproteobacteria bacterium]